MRSSLVVAVAIAMLATLYLAPDAEARRSRVERIYKGKIVLLKKRPPRHFSNQGRWLRFLRVNKAKHVWPIKKNNRYTKKWKVEFMAFFNRKLKDIEVKVWFYDATDRKLRFIEAVSFYTQRGQTILASSIKLDRSHDGFQVNRRMLMVIKTPRGRELARTRFWLRGKGEVYSGRVTFSDKEAKLK